MNDPLRSLGSPTFPPPGGAGSGLAGKRILVVEDEAILALDIELGLTDAGAQVLGPIHSLQAALDVYDTLGPIDAAILDVDLRSVEVFPLARRLQHDGVPFLFHTAYGDREPLRTEFRDAPVCVKPNVVAALLDRVAVLAQGAALPGD